MPCSHLIKFLRQFALIGSYAVFSASAYAQPPEACSCLWQGSFSKIIDQADLIVGGEVIARKGNSADLQIEHTFLDRQVNLPEFNSVIRIWGDNGQLCRPDINNYPPGTRWLFALKKITEPSPDGFNPNTPNISHGRRNDYYLSQCGAYWLQLHDNYASGNLVKGRRWQWHNEKMTPVRLELIDAYINQAIPEQALIEAARPSSEAKKLMDKTRQFIWQQQSTAP